MAKLPPFPGTTGRRDWRTAFDAIRKLLANGDDTTQVFRIMRALNVGNAPMNYARFIATPEGGRMAYERVELAERLGVLANGVLVGRLVDAVRVGSAVVVDEDVAVLPDDRRKLPDDDLLRTASDVRHLALADRESPLDHVSRQLLPPR